MMEQLVLNQMWTAASLIANRPRRGHKRAPGQSRWEQLVLSQLWFTASFIAAMDLAAKRKAAQQLVTDNLWVVDAMVAKYRGKAPQADLREAGILGLAVAAQKFDPASGNKFATYAWNWVRGHMFSEVRKSHVVPVPDQLMRKARREGKEVRCVIVNKTIDEPVAPEQEQAADLGRIKDAIDKLAPTERIAVRRTMAGCTVSELAGQMGLGEERVREILSQARERLAEELGT